MTQHVGRLPPGQTISSFVLTSESGLQLTVLDLGATVHSVLVPTGGPPAEMVLGYDDLAGYLAPDNPYLGATVGRYANRIAEASFVLDDVRYAVSANEGSTCLHGGVDAFHTRTWTVVDHDAATLTLELVSPDGDQGFPGELRARATYAVHADSVTVDYEATCDRPTVVSLTNHTYFNLSGSDGGGVDDHLLNVDADHYLPVDTQSIPEGAVEAVDGTPFDLRVAAELRTRVRSGHPQVSRAAGLDHAYVLNGRGVRLAARLEHERSGRVLEVETDQPSLQVYTGNMLDGTLPGRRGHLLRQGDGICLETQQYPNAPNRADFLSPILRPGETYRSHTRWTFVS